MGARRKARDERRWARGAGREAPSARRLSGGPGGPHPSGLTGMRPGAPPGPDLPPAARGPPPAPPATAPDARTTDPAAPHADPLLAACYDTFDGERDALDHYETILEELGARTVIDVGCGTGALAVRLARRGLEVTGIDPARASLDVAHDKPYAEAASWVHG